MSSSLGIYFGPHLICAVETKGNKIINILQNSRSVIVNSDAEAKVPDDLKMVAFFEEEFRKNKIEAKEVSIVLSGKDLIMRTFELPLLPKEEIARAVGFEAKKYIPFRIEELVSDFQLSLNKERRINDVLFAAIKTETLDSYLSIFGQMNMRVTSLEYAGFSILRLLKLAGVQDNATVGVVGVDMSGEDEINFLVLKDGFPLFSRDIILSGNAQESVAVSEKGPEAILEKLKSEIRISLDYYRRKFPSKDVTKVYLISGQGYSADLEAFIKEMGFLVTFVDVARHIGQSADFSLGLMKAYSLSLSKTVKTPLKLNLLAVKERLRPKKAEALATEHIAITEGLKVNPKAVAAGLLICVLALGYSFYRKLPLQEELNKIRQNRPQVASLSADAGYDELTKVNSEYEEKLKTLDSLIKQQLRLTESIDVIPKLILGDMWLTSFYFRNSLTEAQLILEGTVRSQESQKEFESVNSFVAKLRADSRFIKRFQNITVESLSRGQIGNTPVANFRISCTGQLTAMPTQRQPEE